MDDGNVPKNDQVNRIDQTRVAGKLPLTPMIEGHYSSDQINQLIRVNKFLSVYIYTLYIYIEYT